MHLFKYTGRLVSVTALSLVLMFGGVISSADVQEFNLPEGDYAASELKEGIVYIVNEKGTAIVLSDNDDIKVDTIISAGDKASLTIKGSDSGKLTLSNGIVMTGSDNVLTVRKGNISVTNSGKGTVSGINVTSFEQEGGKLTVSAESEDGETDAFVFAKSFNVSGGDITLKSVNTDHSAYGLKGGKLTVSDGQLTVQAESKVEACAYSLSSVDIKGGKVAGSVYSASSSAVGMKEGAFNVSGGTVDLKVVSDNDTASAVKVTDNAIKGGSIKLEVKGAFDSTGISFAKTAEISKASFDIDVTDSSKNAAAILASGSDTALKFSSSTLKLQAKGGSASAIKCSNDLSFEDCTLDLKASGTRGDAKAIDCALTCSISGKTAVAAESSSDTSATAVSAKILKMGGSDAKVNAVSKGNGKKTAVAADTQEIKFFRITTPKKGLFADGVIKDPKDAVAAEAVIEPVEEHKLTVIAYDESLKKFNETDFLIGSNIDGDKLKAGKREYSVREQEKLALTYSVSSKAAHKYELVSWNVKDSSGNVISKDKTLNYEMEDSDITICAVFAIVKEDITAIDITLSETPVTGKEAVAPTLAIKGEPGNKLKSATAEWYGASEKRTLTKKDTFAPGSEYNLLVYIVPNIDYKLSDKIAVKVNGNVMKTAKYDGKQCYVYTYKTKKQYKVTFDGKAQTVIENECAVKPKNPTKKGWTFTSWGKSKTASPFNFETKITKNTTLISRYQCKLYVYNTTGGKVIAKAGSNASIQNKDYKKSVTLTLSEEKTGKSSAIYTVSAKANTGYTFKEWRLGSATGEVISTSRKFNYTLSGNAKLYAIFAKKAAATPTPTPTPAVQAGDKFTAGNNKYKALSTTEAAFTGVVDKTAKMVKIPDTVTRNNVVLKVVQIAPKAFKNNKALTKVVIGKNVNQIGDKAFFKATSLKKVTIGKNIVSVGKCAFYGCKNLSKVTVRSVVLKKVGKKAFKGIKKKAKIVLPKAKFNKYKKLIVKSKVSVVIYKKK